jgi:hypothetical protein
MSDLYLNFEDRAEVMEFLSEISVFADKKSRGAAEDLIRASDQGRSLTAEKLADFTRRMAVATWPARVAMQDHFSHRAVIEEWEKVASQVEPALEKKMFGFRKGAGAKTLDDLLKHPDAGDTFSAEDLLAIQDVRRRAREDFWNTKKATLKTLIKKYQQVLGEYQARFQKLRELAAVFTTGVQDEIYSKLQHFEDRVLFGLESVPLEILDEEILYYVEQKELPL